MELSNTEFSQTWGPNKLIQSATRSNMIKLWVIKIKGEQIKQHPLGK